MSAGSFDHTQAAQEIGILASLNKPVRQSHLFDCLLTALSSKTLLKSATSDYEALKNKPAKKNARILVAEDNAINQRVITLHLKKLGYSCNTVSNGKEAVETLSTIPYDLVFMDCQMPEMDGYEATTKIRRTESATRRNIIIAMTANALSGDKEKCIAAGMNDYLSKPIDEKRLKTTLEKWLEHKEGQTENRKALVDILVLEKLGELQEEGEDHPAIELIDIFLNKAPTLLTEMKAALKEEDYSGLSKHAHYLKSSCATLGAKSMREVCHKIEAMTFEFSEAKYFVDELEQDYLQVESELRDWMKNLNGKVLKSA